ncbi:M28 family metallopeptidase [soil metagenome]
MLRIALVLCILCPVAAAQSPVNVEPYRDAAARISAAALADSSAFELTALFVDRFPRRLSGSQMLEDGIDWLLERLVEGGIQNVRGQEVVVPHWVRGEESLTVIEPVAEAVPMALLGLGGSVGTDPGGLTAEVLVVRDFDELEARSSEVAGRIVVFNAPFTTYGATVQYRSTGPARAAALGAAAALVRSITQYSLQTPHTGGTRYAEDGPRIPAAAITIEAAEWLQRRQNRGDRTILNLQMGAHQLPDAISRNVIGEIVGRERPEEVVVLGGHIDSWDIGQGAHDDAAGVFVTWRAMQLLHDLGLQPRRTVRFIAWTNEENGLRGAWEYRNSLSDEDIANHVLALEVDFGVFEPVGFGIAADEGFAAALKPIEELIWPLLTDSDQFQRGIVPGSGAPDLIPLMQAGIPGVGFHTDNERYFWYHHTAADTVDKLDPGYMARAVAAIATFIYVVADMPETIR